jgi:hypothetical protein
MSFSGSFRTGRCAFSILESRQDDVENKVSRVLASVEANTKALEELKSMLTRCMGKFKDPEDCSPTESRSVLEEWAEFRGPTHPTGLQGNVGGDGLHGRKGTRTSDCDDVTEVSAAKQDIGRSATIVQNQEKQRRKDQQPLNAPEVTTSRSAPPCNTVTTGVPTCKDGVRFKIPEGTKLPAAAKS